MYGAILLVVLTLIFVFIHNLGNTPNRRYRHTPHDPEADAAAMAENMKNSKRYAKTRLIRHAGDLPAPRAGLHTKDHKNCKACERQLNRMMGVKDD